MDSLKYHPFIKIEQYYNESRWIDIKAMWENQKDNMMRSFEKSTNKIIRIDKKIFEFFSEIKRMRRDDDISCIINDDFD